MEKKNTLIDGVLFLTLITLGIFIPNTTYAAKHLTGINIQDSLNYKEYAGIVIDEVTKYPLTSALISVDNTNISTVTNDEGKFSLKVPSSVTATDITISYLGYMDKKVP